MTDGWTGGTLTWLTDGVLEASLLIISYEKVLVYVESFGHRGSNCSSSSGCSTFDHLALVATWPKRLTILTPQRTVHLTPLSPCGRCRRRVQGARLIALRPLHRAVSIGCWTPTHRAPSAIIPNMA